MPISRCLAPSADNCPARLEYIPAHVMLLWAGKRGVASPGRLPGAPRPLGHRGRLGAALRDPASPACRGQRSQAPALAPTAGSQGPGFSQEGWGAQNEGPQRVWGASELLGLQMGEAPGGGGATGLSLGLRRHPGDWQRLLSPTPPTPLSWWDCCHAVFLRGHSPRL